MSTNKISKVQLNNEQYSLKGDANNIKDVMQPTVDDIYSKITTGTDNTTILQILENISGLQNSKADRSELDSIWNQINALNARIPRSSINYYFAYKASTHIPQRPGNDQDYVPDGWTGYPITPNANEVLYMTMARKSNDEWINWEGNYRWTQPIAYSDKSSQTLNIDGSIALYKLSQGTPTLSPDERRTKAYPSGWSTTPDFASQGNKEIYMITAKTLNGDLVAVNGYYWSAPMRIGDGTTSGTGADGQGYNYIYTLKPSSSSFSAPSFTVQQIEESSTHSITENGTTWYDRPQGVSEINKYEYISVSVGSDDSGWSAWSTPVVWSKWGERGMDGDAVEYIYKRTESEQVLTLNQPYSGRVGNQAYSNIYANNEVYSKNDDFIPNGWEDNPSGVDENNPCEYVAIRKKKDEVWQPFEQPVLWAKYGKQGLPGVVNGYILYSNNDSVIIDDDFFINNNNDSASFNRLAGATYKLEKTSGESISPTYSIDADKSLPTGITATIDSNGVLTYNVTATNSKIPLGTYYVIINGKVDGNIVASRKQTLYVTDFNNGASYQLIVTPPTIKTNTNGKFREAVTISVQVNEIHESVTTLSSLLSGMYYDVEENGDSSHKVASNVTSLTRQIANAGDTAPDYYVVNLYLNGVLVDSEAIDIYKDGEKGDPGEPGGSSNTFEVNPSVLYFANGSFTTNVVCTTTYTGSNLKVHCGSGQATFTHGEATFTIANLNNIKGANNTPQAFQFILKDGSTTLASKTIPIIYAQQGINGAVLRYRGKWAEILDFENGVAGNSATFEYKSHSDSGNIDYIDVVSTNGENGLDYYQCKDQHTVGVGEAGPLLSNTNYWERADQFKFIVTETLIADYISAVTVSADDVVITEKNDQGVITDIVAGMTSSHSNRNELNGATVGDVRIWAGTTGTQNVNIQNAPFQVTQDGKMISTNAYVNGQGIFDGEVTARSLNINTPDGKTAMQFRILDTNITVDGKTYLAGTPVIMAFKDDQTYILDMTNITYNPDNVTYTSFSTRTPTYPQNYSNIEEFIQALIACNAVTGGYSSVPDATKLNNVAEENTLYLAQSAKQATKVTIRVDGNQVPFTGWTVNYGIISSFEVINSQQRIVHKYVYKIEVYNDGTVIQTDTTSGLVGTVIQDTEGNIIESDLVDHPVNSIFTANAPVFAVMPKPNYNFASTKEYQADFSTYSGNPGPIE